MTRRIRRKPDYEIVLEIKSDDFLQTPQERQRNWLLNRSLKEFGDDLEALNEFAREFITGGDPIEMSDRAQATLSEQDIMEDWQIPIMQSMADQVVRPGCDLLEIGFGRGVASRLIQAAEPGSHTIIECNENIVRNFEEWREQFPGKEISMVQGMWQDVIDGLPDYDAIFFHTYPLNDQEYLEQVAQSVTFAEHFFPTAAAHLRQGGAFTYLSNEADSLSRAHQRLLFRHFSSFTLSLVRELNIPSHSRDSHWLQQMVVVKAVK